MKERALAARVQGALERVYRLDRVADVEDYVSEEGAEREALLLKQAEDGAIEMRLCLPVIQPDASLDAICQVIEGVSHFVYVAERARVWRETTQLELELQAEVDKWVVLAESIGAFDAERSAVLRERLYERVAFEHDETSEIGQRYRLANEAAHRFVRRLEREYLSRERLGDLRAELRRFFHVGQEEKLRLGRAA
ncbi:MAG TPA: hypothetical protein VF765_10635 [Polyangiaceae bacterium]